MHQWRMQFILPINSYTFLQVYIKDVLRIVPGIRDVHSFQEIFSNMQVLENIKSCYGVNNVMR